METSMSFCSNIGKLFKHEFGFERYHEITGLKLIHQNEKTGKYEKYKYRGLTLWLKEIIESVLGIFLIIIFVVLTTMFVIKYLFSSGLLPNLDNIPENPVHILEFSKYILKIAGSFLILDSLLLIAALISSPGIDETIDSISVTIGGVLLLFISNNEENLVQYPELILKVVFPLAIIVVILIYIKHILRKMHKDNGNCNNSKQKASRKSKKAL
jgi:TRAP-type C4-dicarboxylate transport system permease small subunit